LSLDDKSGRPASAGNVRLNLVGCVGKERDFVWLKGQLIDAIGVPRLPIEPAWASGLGCCWCWLLAWAWCRGCSRAVRGSQELDPDWLSLLGSLADSKQRRAAARLYSEDGLALSRAGKEEESEEELLLWASWEVDSDRELLCWLRAVGRGLEESLVALEVAEQGTEGPELVCSPALTGCGSHCKGLGT
jgi:hypothetical protein